MKDAQRLASALQASLDVHHAAGLANHQGGGGGFHQIRDLAPQKFGRELGMFQREDTAESATIRAFGQLNYFSIPDACQQQARLAIHTEETQEMTGGMVGQFSRPTASQIRDTAHIHQVFGKFMHTSCQCIGTIQPAGIVFEQFQVAVTEHART